MVGSDLVVGLGSERNAADLVTGIAQDAALWYLRRKTRASSAVSEGAMQTAVEGEIEAAIVDVRSSRQSMTMIDGKVRVKGKHYNRSSSSVFNRERSRK